MIRITPCPDELADKGESARGASALRYARNPDVVLTAEDETGGVLLIPTSAKLRMLNETGLLLWKLCDGSRTVDDLAAEVSAGYEGVSEAEVRDDVQEFVDDLMSSFFLWVDGATGEESG